MQTYTMHITYWDEARQADIAVSRYCLSNLRSKIPGNFQRSTCFEWSRHHPAWRSWNYPYHPKAGWHCCYPVCSTPLQARIWSTHVDDVCRNDPCIWNETLDSLIIVFLSMIERWENISNYVHCRKKMWISFSISLSLIFFPWLSLGLILKRPMFLIVFGNLNFGGFSF